VSRVVTRCTNSTVTEAWATVFGSPAPVIDDETGALVHMARKKLPPLQSVPAVVLAQVGAGPVPPFWKEQFAWDAKQFLVRVGHRYLSVHFLKKQGRYETYPTSIEPAISAWLQAAEDAFGMEPTSYPVDRVGFGYVNTFDFASEDFDLSKYFRINFGVEVPSASQGLSGLEVRFGFVDAELASAHVITELMVQPLGQGADQRLVVQTKVRAESHGLQNCGFGSRDRLSEAVFAAKEAAKRVFFEIATEATHTLMGARYDQG
jgi:hypothetical protein